MLLHVPIASLLIIERKRHNEEMSLASNWFVGFAIAVMLELSVYINMKAKAKLFLKTKQSEQQQRQLADLLNLLPVNVLICAKPHPADSEND